MIQGLLTLCLVQLVTNAFIKTPVNDDPQIQRFVRQQLKLKDSDYIPDLVLYCKYNCEKNEANDSNFFCSNVFQFIIKDTAQANDQCYDCKEKADKKANSLNNKHLEYIQKSFPCQNLCLAYGNQSNICVPNQAKIQNRLKDSDVCHQFCIKTKLDHEQTCKFNENSEEKCFTCEKRGSIIDDKVPEFYKIKFGGEVGDKKPINFDEICKTCFAKDKNKICVPATLIPKPPTPVIIRHSEPKITPKLPQPSCSNSCVSLESNKLKCIKKDDLTGETSRDCSTCKSNNFSAEFDCNSCFSLIENEKNKPCEDGYKKKPDPTCSNSCVSLESNKLKCIKKDDLTGETTRDCYTCKSNNFSHEFDCNSCFSLIGNEKNKPCEDGYKEKPKSNCKNSCVSLESNKLKCIATKDPNQTPRDCYTCKSNTFSSEFDCNSCFSLIENENKKPCQKAKEYITPKRVSIKKQPTIIPTNEPTPTVSTCENSCVGVRKDFFTCNDNEGLFKSFCYKCIKKTDGPSNSFDCNKCYQLKNADICTEEKASSDLIKLSVTCKLCKKPKEPDTEESDISCSFNNSDVKYKCEYKKLKIEEYDLMAGLLHLNLLSSKIKSALAYQKADLRENVRVIGNKFCEENCRWN